MEELITKLEAIKKGVDYANVTDLFDGGYLDSFDVIQIISMLDDDYGITVPPSQIIPKNFNSAKAIYEMIQRLDEE